MKIKSAISVLIHSFLATLLLMQASHAQPLQSPSEVVNSYLASLVAGDVGVLVSLIDGAKKRDNPQLTLEPEYYGQFLKDHYRGAVVSVEEISQDGDGWQARVRFDFPTSGSQTTTLILRLVGGEWKVTYEIQEP